MCLVVRLRVDVGSPEAHKGTEAIQKGLVMSNTLNVRITTRSSPTGDVYEGTVSIADVRPTKLVRRADGTTLFPTRSALCGTARNVAKRLGYTDVAFTDPAQSQTKATAKKAAKKSSTATSTTSSTSSTSTASNSEARRSEATESRRSNQTAR